MVETIKIPVLSSNAGELNIIIIIIVIAIILIEADNNDGIV